MNIHKTSLAVTYYQQIKISCIALGLLVASHAQAAGTGSNISIALSEGNVTILYPTSVGYTYEIWTSTSLTNSTWNGPFQSQAGTGNQESGAFSTTGFESRFFEVRATEDVPADLAPTSAEFAALYAGAYLPGTDYYIISETQFFWDGDGFAEYGNWSYTKTGANTATSLFTYDEDGNNPNIYHEGHYLTYTSPGAGTFLYYEDGIILGSGTFDFN